MYLKCCPSFNPGYLYHVSYWMLPDLKRDSTQHINDIGVIHHSSQNGSQIEPSETIKAAAKATSINILGTLTKPFTKSIIQVGSLFSGLYTN